MVCHGELARSKPPAEHLTSFYWMIAAGGALGGTLVVAVAPHVFRSFREFHVALLGCGFLLFLSYTLEDRTSRTEATTWSPVLVVFTAFLLPHVAFLVPRLNRFLFLNQEYWTLPLCFAVWLIGRAAFPKEAQSSAGAASSHRSLQVAWQPVTALLLMALFTILCASYVYFAGSQIVYQERNFFGVKYVSNEPEGFALFSGNTMHGLQLKDPARRSVPTLYFAPQTDAGTLLRTYPRTFGDGHLRFGIIGMGVGCNVCWSSLDFLLRAASLGDVALGDARLCLERELAEGYSSVSTFSSSTLSTATPSRFIF